MRLAFIHPFIYRYPRGIERYTLHLSDALAKHGAEVDILTWRWARPIAWQEVDPRVIIRTLPTSRYYAAQCIVPFYVMHLARQHYSNIFIHFADYGEAAALKVLSALRRRLPWSIVLHYPYSQVPHRYESFARSGLARGARSIIAVSKFVASEAKSILGRTCEVIPHGVDTSIFRPNRALRSAVRAELGVPDNTPLLLTVAALEERKGVQWMLRALRAVAQRFPTVVYVVVGDGPYLPVLERLAQELGIVGHVHFLSSRSDVERFYQAADLFILLSRGEASPLVVLEAPACQLPIVASLHPPFNELISPQWGRQVDETDAELVADTIAKLLADTRMLQHMGQAGYKHILEHHSWSAVAERYLDLIV